MRKHLSNDKDDKLSIIYQIHDNILNFLNYNFSGCHLLALLFLLLAVGDGDEVGEVHTEAGAAVLHICLGV